MVPGMNISIIMKIMMMRVMIMMKQIVLNLMIMSLPIYCPMVVNHR